jgi:hypothetical protein
VLFESHLARIALTFFCTHVIITTYEQPSIYMLEPSIDMLDAFLRINATRRFEAMQRASRCCTDTQNMLYNTLIVRIREFHATRSNKFCIDV